VRRRPFCKALAVPRRTVNAIGATRPEWRELDDDLVIHGPIFADIARSALRESGDFIASRRGATVTEIGAVVAGVDPGRAHAQEDPLFKSVGVARRRRCSRGVGAACLKPVRPITLS